MDAVAHHVSRVVRRWVLVFCNSELIGGWIGALTRWGLEHVRVAAWVKEGCTPQFSGDRPASAFESIVIAHPRGRKRWNAGGKRGLYMHAVENQNRGTGRRVMPIVATPKPIPLMIELVSDFTDPNDLVIDPFAGGASTGVACIRRGRRFSGCELRPAVAARANERLRAELSDSTLAAREAGQLTLMGGR